MVAYGEELLVARSNEWQPYYVNYHRLKEFIKAIQAEKSENANRAFSDELRANMKRVDTFYSTQEKRMLETVKHFPEQYAESPEEEIHQKAEVIREDLAKLQEFALVNYEGLRKITKKFDKKVGTFDAAAAEHAEPGREGSSQSMPTHHHQDHHLKGLMEHMLEVMDTHPFAQAKARLGEIQSSLDEWVSSHGDVWHSPNVGADRFQRQVSLVVPLMGRSKREILQEKVLKVKKNSKTAFEIVKKFARKWKSIWVLTVIVLLFAIFGQEYVPDWTGKSFLVVWVTLVSLVLLASALPSDGVVIGATLFLTICGVLSTEDAWAAFSNDVVLSVAGLGCIADIVHRTGIIDIVFLKILGKPRTLRMAMLRLFVPAMILNVCISNTCVMSCLLPVLEKWSVQIGFHKAFFLMPLSYILLICGCFAIFSTSTNLIAQGMLVSHNQPPFENFDLSVPVTICSLVTILYLLVATPIVLRRFGTESDGKDSLEDVHRLTAKTYDIRIQIVGKALDGQTLASSGIAPRLLGGISDVVACWRYGVLESTIYAEFEVALDDVFLVNTSVDGIIAMRELPGISLLPLDSTELHAGESSKDLRELVEVVLDVPSTLVGHRLVNSHKYFERSMDCSIVGFHSFQDGNMRKLGARESDAMVKTPTEKDITSLVEKSGANPQKRMGRGDHIVFDAPKDFYKKNKHLADFITVTRLSQAHVQVDIVKAYTAGAIMAMMIILVATSTLPLLSAVMLAIGALVLTGCTKLEDVRSYVKLSTVLTIVGAFGLGTAIGQQKVANALADLLLYLLAPFGTVGLLSAIYLATVALGVVFHGTAVVVLMYPICEVAASKQDLPIHMVVGLLCIAVAMQVLSPISYQTNMMAYGHGGYEFTDFTQLGSGLVLVMAFVSIPLCQYWFA